MSNEERNPEILEAEVNETQVEQPEKKHFFRSNKKIIALCLAGCLLSSGLGFAGGYLAVSLTSSNNDSNKSVLYQSVIQTKADGSEATNMSIPDIAATVKESVVEIVTSTVKTSTFLQQYVASGAGSGVIISSDGTIITNNHVIEGATSITVRLSDGTEYDAEVIGSDSQTDVAVIKINASNLKPAVFGDSSNLVVGQSVVAVGNPLGELGGSVTEGIISALDRSITISGQTMTLLQTTAAINPGNSGGGLFNTNGELIGIVNAKSSGSDVEGIGFAIPVNIAKEVAEQLITNGKVEGRLTLGISYVEISNVQTAMSYGVNTLGLLVAEVSEGSNAERAGFMKGDLIIAADEEQISSSAELKAKLQSHVPGDTMTFKVIRDKHYIDLSVVLE